jgi:hypothetical protein
LRFYGVSLSEKEGGSLDGKVYGGDGCDPASAFHAEFIKRLSRYIGAINTTPFYGLEPYECKYLGPEQSWVNCIIETGNRDNPAATIKVIELQHQFQIQLEQEDVMVGDVRVPHIPGWDYVDVHYEESLVDIGDGKKIPLATAQQVDVVPILTKRVPQ